MNGRRAAVAATTVVAVSWLSPLAGAVGGEGALLDLQAIIDAARPGDVVVLEPGTYRGGVVVDKPLTVTGGGRSVVTSTGDGVVIEITAPGVTLEGLVIRDSGSSLDREDAGVSVNAPDTRIRDNRFENVLFGVFLREADGSVVAGNVIGSKDLDAGRRGDPIRIWESDGVMIEGNRVVGGRDVVIWYSDDVTVRDNEVRGGRYGLHFMFSDDAVVEGNRFEQNSVGSFLMYSRRLTVTENLFAENRGPSGYGIGLKDMDGVEAQGNRLVGNRVGVYLDNSPRDPRDVQHFTRNLVAYNDVGVLFMPSVRGNQWWENALVDNRAQVAIHGSGRLRGNDFTVEGRGNYWSDFAGYDGDGDGVGDVEHRVEALFPALTGEYPELAVYSDTPAARALDLAARMFPVLRPEPAVVDDAPLTAMPSLPALGAAPRSWSPSTLAVSGALVVAVLGVLIFGRAPVARRGARIEVAA